MNTSESPVPLSGEALDAALARARTATPPVPLSGEELAALRQMTAVASVARPGWWNEHQLRAIGFYDAEGAAFIAALSPSVVARLLAMVDRAQEDAALLDRLDALEDARLIVRTDDGDDEVLWWRMSMPLRERGYHSTLDGPIRDILAARATSTEKPHV